MKISLTAIAMSLLVSNAAFAQNDTPPCANESINAGVNEGIRSLVVEGIDGKRVALNGVTLKVTATPETTNGLYFENKVLVEFTTQNKMVGNVLVHVHGRSDTCAILGAK